MYSSGQVSGMLAIPSSTLRRYVSQFADHLEEGARRQRARRFSDLDLVALSRARELLQQGKTPEEVNALLGVVGDDDLTATKALALPLPVAFAEILDAARSLRLDVDDLAHGHEDVSRRLADLEAWATGGWLRRLLGPPPKE